MRYWKMFLFTAGLFTVGVFIFFGIIMITEGYLAEAIILSIAGGLAFGLRGSWGEDVCCQIESIGDHQTRVTITSKSVSKFAFVDSGINAQNVQKIVDIISS